MGVAVLEGAGRGSFLPATCDFEKAETREGKIQHCLACKCCSIMVVFSIGASPLSDMSHAHTLLIDVRNASQADRLAAVVRDGGEDAIMPVSQQLLASFLLGQSEETSPLHKTSTHTPPLPPTIAHHRQGAQCINLLFEAPSPSFPTRDKATKAPPLGQDNKTTSLRHSTSSYLCPPPPLEHHRHL